MSPQNKLRAIKRLRMSDGLSFIDAHDISLWVGMAGPENDVSKLNDKIIERINDIYLRYYEDL